jgi:predicted nuclease of predicted toxin-antitoxin system
MVTFLIDEDMPRSTVKELIKVGYQALDVRDIGLRGQSDKRIFAYSQKHKMVLLSADQGFANNIRFPIGSHNGIIVLRFPNEISTQRLNKELLKSLSGLEDRDIYSNLIIISPGRVRIHRVD